MKNPEVREKIKLNSICDGKMAAKRNSPFYLISLKEFWNRAYMYKNKQKYLKSAKHIDLQMWIFLALQ